MLTLFFFGGGGLQRLHSPVWKPPTTLASTSSTVPKAMRPGKQRSSWARPSRNSAGTAATLSSPPRSTGVQNQTVPPGGGRIVMGFHGSTLWRARMPVWNAWVLNMSIWFTPTAQIDWLRWRRLWGPSITLLTREKPSTGEPASGLQRRFLTPGGSPIN